MRLRHGAGERLASAPAARRSIRSSPSRCRHVEEERRPAAARARRRSTSSRRPKRRIVVWNGCGAPSGSSAIASPSRMMRCAGSARASSTTSGTAGGDVVQRSRVKTRTSSPSRCTWTRAPSSLYSTARRAEARERVRRRSRPCRASIGCTGRKSSRRKRAEPGRALGERRLRDDGAQVAGEHDGAPHVAAPGARGARERLDQHALRARPGGARRRASRRGSPARRPSPARAGRASSRPRSRRRAGARAAARSGRTRRRPRRASASPPRRDCRDRAQQPPPSRGRCGPAAISPARKAMPIAISSGASARRHAARCSIFAVRARVSATRRDATTRSCSSIAARLGRDGRAVHVRRAFHQPARRTIFRP